MSVARSDAIIALAGGLNVSGDLLPRNYQRLNTAIELFHAGVAERVIVTGGWSFLSKQPAADRTEGRQMRQYALSYDVPDAAIFVEDDSHETLGSAVHTKRRILQPNNWRDLILVTSKSHLPRSERIFSFVLGDGYHITGVPSAESLTGIKTKLYEPLGSLMLDYVAKDVTRGDDAALEQRIVDRIPGYGGVVTTKNLVMNSLLNFAKHHTTIKF